TGSTDRTKEVAASYGARLFDFNPQTHPEHFFELDGQTCLGDFAAARNFSYAHASKDFVMWLDADAVVEGAAELRAAVSRFGVEHDAIFTPCVNTIDGETFHGWRERVTRRGQFQWKYPVHETLHGE